MTDYFKCHIFHHCYYYYPNHLYIFPGQGNCIEVISAKFLNNCVAEMNVLLVFKMGIEPKSDITKAPKVS